MACLQGVQKVQLQREAGQRLNALMDEMRNSPKADLSAKNLGNEGAAYVSEALAFNTTYVCDAPCHPKPPCLCQPVWQGRAKNISQQSCQYGPVTSNRSFRKHSSCASSLRLASCCTGRNQQWHACLTACSCSSAIPIHSQLQVMAALQVHISGPEQERHWRGRCSSALPGP